MSTLLYEAGLRVYLKESLVPLNGDLRLRVLCLSLLTLLYTCNTHNT